MFWYTGDDQQVIHGVTEGHILQSIPEWVNKIAMEDSLANLLPDKLNLKKIVCAEIKLTQAAKVIRK